MTTNGLDCLSEKCPPKYALSITRAMRGEQNAASKLSRLKERLLSMVDEIKESQSPVDSGYYALFKRKDKGFECIGIVNPDLQDEIAEEWDLCIPIPEPSSVPEFQGW